jgi:hypothetical protein
MELTMTGKTLDKTIPRTKSMVTMSFETSTMKATFLDYLKDLRDGETECVECDGEGQVIIISGPGTEAGHGYIPDEKKETCEECNGSGREELCNDTWKEFADALTSLLLQAILEDDPLVKALQDIDKLADEQEDGESRTMQIKDRVYDALKGDAQ